ncbi:MAG: hypothetical protein M3256_21125 [Actinomycetota bacterium]|nr:hypothetical protein [Actinomycetota bacterium]
MTVSHEKRGCFSARPNLRHSQAAIALRRLAGALVGTSSSSATRTVWQSLGWSAADPTST